MIVGSFVCLSTIWRKAISSKRVSLHEWVGGGFCGAADWAGSSALKAPSGVLFFGARSLLPILAFSWRRDRPDVPALPEYGGFPDGRLRDSR
jgi:hypothetical protein